MGLLYEKESFEIRGACFWVWKEFGSAFKESIVDNALTEEFVKRGLQVENQKRINIYYNGKKVGVYVSDKVVNGAIIVEVKAKPFLTNQDIKQFWHYLKGTDYKLGFLINFGEKLEIKRVVYDEARDPLDIREKISVADSREDQRSRGFTLMEIMVATLIFAIVFSSLLSLFNYVLKINRRTEAVRQAAQDTRDFVEFLVKEVRNGQIDYNVVNGEYTAAISGSSPCGAGRTVGQLATSTDSTTYGLRDNKLGIVNTDGVEECFYYGKSDGSYADTVGGVPATFSIPGQGTLVLQKQGITGAQILNPPNASVNQLMFLVRPVCDPYTLGPCVDYPDPTKYPNVQPSVVIIIQFTVKLPTGESVALYYQTSVSSNKYDIP